MEFCNRRPGLGHQYYSNEYYSLLALITYGALDKHSHMDPYGRHPRHNDNTTKFRVISGCICFWRRAVSEFGSVSHSLANLRRLAAKAKKIDSGWSKRQNNDKLESQRRAVPYSRDAWHGCGKNKQHKHSSKYFAYTIKYKIVIGIDTKIQSTLGPKHDQINTALIAHHLEVGANWTLAESSAQFSLSSSVIVGRSNHLSTNERFLVRWRK